MKGAWLAAVAVRSMLPDHPFAEEVLPPPPDYTQASSWSALPELHDLADRAPTGLSVADPAKAPVDVFYLHPTSYLGPNWTGPIDDPKLNDDTDRLSTGIQASAFSGCCAIYAPRYRQANGAAFVRASADADRAVDLAYQDVSAAFDAFLHRRGTERPFILVSHSQGTVMAERLLEERVSGTPLASRLVAAYLIGGRVTVEGLHERAPDLPPCASPEQTGCIIAYNARMQDFQPTEVEMLRPDPRELLCTNPLTWRLDGAYAPAAMNHGAVFLETGDHQPRPAFADAQCEGGTLVVREVERAPRSFMSRLLDRALGPGNLHPMEYQIYFMDLRLNAQTRSSAWLGAQREAPQTEPPGGVSPGG